MSYEASWALCNLVSEASVDQISTLVDEHQYLQFFEPMLNNPDEKIQEIALDAILNILRRGNQNLEENLFVRTFIEAGIYDNLKMLAKKEEKTEVLENILEFFEDVDSWDKLFAMREDEDNFNRVGYYIDNNVYVQFTRED